MSGSSGAKGGGCGGYALVLHIYDICTPLEAKGLTAMTLMRKELQGEKDEG